MGTNAAEAVCAYTEHALTSALQNVRAGRNVAAMATLVTTTALSAAIAGMCVTGLVAASAANTVVNGSWDPQVNTQLTVQVRDLVATALDAVTAGLDAVKVALTAQPTSQP
jgi:hypothetical protein